MYIGCTYMYNSHNNVDIALTFAYFCRKALKRLSMWLFHSRQATSHRCYNGILFRYHHQLRDEVLRLLRHVGSVELCQNFKISIYANRLIEYWSQFSPRQYLAQYKHNSSQSRLQLD